MPNWTPTRVRQVSFALLGVSMFAMTGSRVFSNYIKKGKIGASCYNRGCRPGLFCLKTDAFGLCTRQCISNEDCPAPLDCRPVGDSSVCMLPPDRSFGERCTANEDCTTDMCVSFWVPTRGRSCRLARCLQHCDASRPCPEGSECVDTEELEAPVCVPLSSPKDAEQVYESQHVRKQWSLTEYCN